MVIKNRRTLAATETDTTGQITPSTLSWFNKLRPIPFVQKMLLVHNLYIMIKAGLSLVDALKIMGAQIPNPRLKFIVEQIKLEVEKGRQLSDVLTDFPKVFPTIYVSMIAAGEAAGKLEDSLRQVNEQMHKGHELMSHVRGAMIYPIVVLTAMMGIGIEMVVFVLPKIIVLFNDFNAPLPLATKILIATVKFMGQWGVFVLIGVILLVVGAIYLEKKPAVRRVVHKMNLRLPIAGEIIKKINLATFTLTLSSLLQSTIPIIEAVQITSHVQGNMTYKEALEEVAETLKKGEQLSSILARYPKIFTPMVVQMILVGEQSGQVEQMLGELSQYYSNEVDMTMKNFSTIIEPVIILLLGLAVAGVAVAVIMPMYSLAQNF